jgi:hypothetical protein
MADKLEMGEVKHEEVEATKPVFAVGLAAPAEEGKPLLPRRSVALNLASCGSRMGHHSHVIPF